MLKLLKLSIFLIITIISCGSNSVKDVPKSVGYRLPKTIKPTKYEITLKLAKDFVETNQFVGAVTIYLNCLTETDEIKLHSKDLKIHSATVILNDTSEIRFGDGSLESDPQTDILTIPLNRTLPRGQFCIVINFNGILSLIDMHGFYKSSYVDVDGKIEYLLATQFEPTYARRAFPCFDEPEFKAIFELSITHPSDYNALSNTPIDGEPTPMPPDLIQTYFQPTPPMSTYLIAFTVSKFTCNSGENLNGGLSYRVCSRPEMVNLRQTALIYGPKLMQYLEDFTGSKFQDSGIGKLDQFAIPDFSAGAMENWGLITYKESGLLYDPNESSNNFKERLLMIIAHEFTHSWFGNLITMKWWSDTFLNEGFARLLQYFAAAHVEKFWQLDQQFIIEQFQPVLVTDAASDSKALSSEVETPAEISARFGTISYNKGACILRMVSHMIGSDNFQRGVQNYIKKHASGSVLADDLWTSLNEQSDLSNNLDLITVMREWTYEAGYPVIKVEVHGKDITLSQKKFLYSAESTMKWYVPITYTTANHVKKFVNTKPQAWLLPTEENSTIKNCLDDEYSWIILNNQQTGYYRVDYDETLWERISSALHSDYFNGITPLARSQIIDDLFNFARAGMKTYSYIFNKIEFLRRDSNYYSWYSAFEGFTFVLRKIGNSKLLNNLNELILFLMDDLYKSVPFSEEYPDSQIYTLKQILTLNWACKLGHQQCITIAKQLFYNYQQNNTITLSRNLRGVIYCAVLKHNDNAQPNWEFLWNKYLNTQLGTERVTLLTTLGCVQDKSILKRYLDEIFNENSKVRRQDTSTALSSIYNNNHDGSSIIFNYIVDNYQNVIKFYQSEDSVISLFETLIDRFTISTDVNKVKNFLNSDILTVSDNGKAALQRALTKAEGNLEWISKLEQDLTDYFEQHGNTAIVTKFNGLLLLLLFSILFKL